MPTYRYHCGACDVDHEIFHSIKDTSPQKCPDCKKKMERMIGGGGGVLLKGDGFYTTEYRSDSYKKAEKKDRDAAKPKSDSSSKSDSSKSSSGKSSGSSKSKKKSDG